MTETMTFADRITSILLAGGFTGATRFTPASLPTFVVTEGAGATITLQWVAGEDERAVALAEYEKCLSRARLAVENRGSHLYVHDPGRKPAMTTYHYVITLQFEACNGIQQVSYGHGTFTPAPGQSRADVFGQIFDKAARAGSGVNPVPVFFSLEPDDLGTEAAR